MMRFFRRFKDLGIEGPQANYYDKISHEHRIGEIKEEAEEVAKLIKDEDSVLEVAPGPGYLSIELARLGKYKITGIDISKDLVAIAASNAKEAGVDVDFLQGNASSMPFHENTFNFIICVLSFKNFKEPLKCLNEFYRVLKPGGMALIMDLNRNASMHAMKTFVKNFGLKGISASIAGFIQRNGAYTRKEFETFISQTEFKEYNIKDSSMGFSIYLKK
ncbi:MAG TPA: methyltransferase domain-containing protein [Methylomirabilota bacterium]|nr:methyltransferase domain-containing protein [Methylomirabilota bacterium]